MSFSKLLAAGKSMVGMTQSRSPYMMRPENLLPKFESKKNPFGSNPKSEEPKSQPSKLAPNANPFAAKVAPMETYSLFDAELKPVALKEAKPVVETGPEVVPVSAVVETLSVEQEILSQEVGMVMEQRRMMQPEPKGLVDGSPLGLKTGTPARAPLPAPVVAPPKPSAKPQTSSAPETPSAPEQKSSRVRASQSVQTEQKPGWFASLRGMFAFGARAKNANARKEVQTELSLDRVKVVRNDLNDADLEVVTKTSEKPVLHAMRLQPALESEAGSIGRLASRIFGAGQSLVP